MFLVRRILIIHFLKILDHNKLAFLKAKKNPAFEGGVLVEVENIKRAFHIVWNNL